MKNLFFIFFIISLTSFESFAQNYKDGNLFGFTTNVGSGQFAYAISWSHYHGIGKNKRFKVGYGIRLTNFIGSDQKYITAPAKYTSGKESLVALFTQNIKANLDTVIFEKAQINFLNAGIYLSYTLPFWKDKVDLGVNIDAIGYSFGASRNGLFNNTTVSAKPSGFNALLISDSDKGSLNSEWFVRYWINKRWALKGGYEFLFTEYTTDAKIQLLPNSTDTNDRFRNKASMVMLGIEFAPFRK